MSEPRRVGLLELLRSSIGCQFVIPVYQRNYTWQANKEVKQFLTDLKHVLTNDYKNHFLGIIIYLEKSIDYGTREFSIIDGQQRMTTIFLTIYAIKEILKANNQANDVDLIEGQYLLNPFHKDNPKYKHKLKPLVADDDVYKCIIENRMQDIDDPDSNVFKNYKYISKFLNELVSQGFTPNEILLALDKLYIVCVPISEKDNAQKIFESINSTGVKLTAADLIRNYLLMNLESDLQDQYYTNYWKKIEDNVSTDSKELEMFFRMFLAIKTFNLVAKNTVYRSFVEWVKTVDVTTEDLFIELLQYAKIFNTLIKLPINKLEIALQDSVSDFRKIESDIPLSLIIELFNLYDKKQIDPSVLGQAISAINTYMIRRSICDIASQNISKLFPTILKNILRISNGDYSNLVEILNQEMVGNNVGTSGSYMPTDAQMYDMLINANVYKRPALRIILDRLELNDNPAPVDLKNLSIEHLMPQSPTEEWVEELDTDEETYLANLHRLGNLTLAAKPDNSKMSNLLWEYKNEVLKSTAHLKLNMELIPIQKWTLECINQRTKDLIKRICTVFPYPDIIVTTTSDSDVISEIAARKATVEFLTSRIPCVIIKKNYLLKTADLSKGYVLIASKNFPEGNNEKYWFAYRESRFDKISDCEENHFIFICRNSKTLILDIPKAFIDKYREKFNQSSDENGNITHYHIVIHRFPDQSVTLMLSKPEITNIDITSFVVNEL